MKRYQKGQYGYRNYRRKRELIKVLLGALLILLQLGLRQFTANEGLKNLLTVSAILSVLPAANIASPLLASWKVKTPGEAFYQQIRSYEKNAILLYDLILTSREMILPVDAAAITSGKALLYCKPKKGRELRHMLQARSALVRFSIRSLEFFQLTILPAAQWT